MGYLTLLLGLPALGAVLVALVPGNRPVFVRGVALTSGTAALAVAWSLAAGFDYDASAMQYAEQMKWSPRLGTYYALGYAFFF